VADYNDKQSHTCVIRRHYVFLLESLDVKFSKLVCQLYSEQVVNEMERNDINAEKTSFRANEKLLSVLSRKSPQQFQLFLDALDNCGQQHVRNVIDDSRPGLTTLCAPPKIIIIITNGHLKNAQLTTKRHEGARGDTETKPNTYTSYFCVILWRCLRGLSALQLPMSQQLI